MIWKYVMKKHTQKKQEDKAAAKPERDKSDQRGKFQSKQEA